MVVMSVYDLLYIRSLALPKTSEYRFDQLPNSDYNRRRVLSEHCILHKRFADKHNIFGFFKEVEENNAELGEERISAGVLPKSTCFDKKN